MTGSNADNTTSTSTSTSTLDPVSSLPNALEQIFQLLGHDVPDDVADQDVETLLLQLERADTVGQNVEERMDAVLGKLDQLLSTLQHDGRPQAVNARGDPIEPQTVDKGPGS